MGTGQLMAKVLEVAAGAKSGREIKGGAIARGMLCDKGMIVEGGRPSRPPSLRPPRGEWELPTSKRSSSASTKRCMKERSREQQRYRGLGEE